MKMCLAIVLAFGTFSCLAGEPITAVPYVNRSEAIGPQIADDVRQAFKGVQFLNADSLAAALEAAAQHQPDVLGTIYSHVPRPVRVSRLTHYLTMKLEGASGDKLVIERGDLNDFHWGYLASDIKFSRVRVMDTQGGNLTLQSIETRESTYDFGDRGRRIPPGSVMLLPEAKGSTPGIVTLTFNAGEKKAVWSGSSDTSQIFIATASTTRASEIHVNSEPRGAIVYFNGRQWHRSTNTKSVHDPGMWEVIVKLKGHKDWQGKRFLGAGEAWTIDAVLPKE